MKRGTFFIAISCALAVLSGCKEDNKSQVKTVEWYKQNKTEREQMLAKCMSNPGELAATPNCVNASSAASAVTWGATGSGTENVRPLTADQLKKK